MVTASLPRIGSICHDSGFRLSENLQPLAIGFLATGRDTAASVAKLDHDGRGLANLEDQRGSGRVCPNLYEVRAPEVLQDLFICTAASVGIQWPISMVNEIAIMGLLKRNVDSWKSPKKPRKP